MSIEPEAYFGDCLYQCNDPWCPLCYPQNEYDNEEELEEEEL
jgi:hypothetical protein